MMVILSALGCSEEIEPSLENAEKQLISHTDSTRSDAKPLTIEVQLLTNLDSIPFLPDCGTLRVDFTFKYRVVKVIRGDFDEDIIFINHLCPRASIDSKSLQTNKVDTLTVRKRSSQNALSDKVGIIQQEPNVYEIIYTN